MKHAIKRSGAVLIAGAFAASLVALANMPTARAQSAELLMLFC